MDRVELDANAIVSTAEKLERRIKNRFPKAGLATQAGFLVQLAERAQVRSIEIAKPIWWIRALYFTLGFLVIFGMVAIPLKFNFGSSQERDFGDWIELLEAGINEVVLLGAGIIFLVSTEGRVKRNRTLKELHQIRSFAHVIDMHQLNKDPQRMLGLSDSDDLIGEQQMTPKNLGRYLDYCSELLAISSKIGALYVQNFDDATTLETVTEIETLSSGLSQNIWQKVSVLIEIFPETLQADARIQITQKSPKP